MASDSKPGQPQHGTPDAHPAVTAAPVFRPSVAEFKDPITYLASIRDKAEPFGICKIVPPAGWRPTFAINKDKCTLPTRIQALHMLQHTSSTEASQQGPDSKRFMADYKAWVSRQGGSFKKPPQLYGQDIDLAALHTAVAKRGGYQACCEAGAWRTVGRALQVWRYVPRCSRRLGNTHSSRRLGNTHSSLQIKDRRGDAATQLRTLYSKTLVEYDGYLAGQRGGDKAADAQEAQEADEGSVQTTTGLGDEATAPAAYSKTRSKVVV